MVRHHGVAFPCYAFRPTNTELCCQISAGNELLLELVEAKKEKYEAAISKIEKTVIVTEVLEEVLETRDSSGFIRLNKRSKRWDLLSDKLSRERIGHMFRSTKIKKRNISANTKHQSMQAIEKKSQLKVAKVMPIAFSKSTLSHLNPEVTGRPSSPMGQVRVSESRNASLPVQLTAKKDGDQKTANFRVSTSSNTSLILQLIAKKDESQKTGHPRVSTSNNNSLPLKLTASNDGGKNTSSNASLSLQVTAKKDGDQKKVHFRVPTSSNASLPLQFIAKKDGGHKAGISVVSASTSVERDSKALLIDACDALSRAFPKKLC